MYSTCKDKFDSLFLLSLAEASCYSVHMIATFMLLFLYSVSWSEHSFSTMMRSLNFNEQPRFPIKLHVEIYYTLVLPIYNALQHILFVSLVENIQLHFRMTYSHSLYVLKLPATQQVSLQIFISFLLPSHKATNISGGAEEWLLFSLQPWCKIFWKYSEISYCEIKM